MAQESDTDPRSTQEVLTVLTESQIKPLDIIRLRMDTGERNYQSFERWVECTRGKINQQPSLPEYCSPCTVGLHPETIILTSDIRDVCLPIGEDANLVFSENLTPAQRQQRDDLICESYNEGKCGPMGSMGFSLGQNDWRSRDEVRQRISRLARSKADIGKSSALRNERYLSAFSAIGYSQDSTEASEISGRYSSRSNLRADSQLDQAAREPLERSTLSGENLPQSYCIDYTQFMQTQQLPDSPEFLEDLSRMTSFRADQWDYGTLFKKFNDITGHIQDLDQAFAASPEAKMIYHRLRFLQRNPLIKGIFMANQANREKEELFRIIKQVPRISCSGSACAQSESEIEGLRNYRMNMRNFLRDQDSIRVSVRGAQRLTDFQAERAVERANTQSVTIEVLNEPGTDLSSQRYRRDPAEWTRYCDVRSNSRRSSLLDELETELGERLPLNPQQDEAYRTLNETSCAQERANSAGQTMVFSTFLQGKCEGTCSPAKRTELFREFLRSYPQPTSGQDRPEIGFLFLLGEDYKAPEMSQENYRNMNTISADAAVSRSPVTYNPQSLSSESATRIMASTPASSPLATSSQTGRSPIETQVPDMQSPLNSFSQTVVAPDAARLTSSEPLGATAASESIEEESDAAKALRDEISSLREVIAKDPQNGGPRTPQVVNDLTQRLAGLEKRLETLRETERENEELRNQIAESEARNTPPRRVDPRPVARDNGRRLASAQSGAQSGDTSGSAISAPLSGGNGQFVPSSVSGRTSLPSGARPVISSSNRDKLSGYGIQSSSVPGGIVVADTSSTINYQELQNQSEGSSLSLPVELAEYNLIAANNTNALRPYVDRCRALAGEVCRFNISAPGAPDTLEFYVVKNAANENDISIIPSRSRDRGPASVSVITRENTLENLRYELGN